MEAFANRITPPRVVEKITFYADNSEYRNKLFTFKTVGYIAAFGLLQSFSNKGNYIRAAYVKGYDLHYDVAEPFQQSLSKEFLTKLNNGFKTGYSEFYLSLI
jgi:hypothetical protein